MLEVKKGWSKTKRDSLLTPGSPEFAYIKAKENEAPWAVIADHTGVVIRGESPRLYEHSHLDDFAWIVADAFREYLKFRRDKIQVVSSNEINEINK